jgi:hypothetical protein
MGKTITKNGELFKFKNKKNLNISPIKSYYGWEENDTLGLYNYFTGYWRGAQYLYEKIKESSQKSEIEITDTLIFPMIFLYRHAFELIIKYLYFKYSFENEDEKKKFLEKNHNLTSLWKELRHHLEQYLLEQKSEKNLDIIENYINKFNNFDNKSMTFRYPMDKNLNPSHNKQRILDDKFFSEKMDQVFVYLLEIDFEIRNKVSYIKIKNSKISKDELIQLIEENLKYVKGYIDYLESEYEVEQEEIEPTQLKIDFKSLSQPEKGEQYLFDKKYITIVILCLLMYAGRDIEQLNVKLSNNEKRYEDFIKLLIVIYNQQEFDIKNDSQYEIVYELLISKRADLVKEWLKICIKEFNNK